MYAHWIILSLASIPLAVLCVLKWKGSREENAAAEQWDTFNAYVEWRKGVLRKQARAGFATFGMLLLTAGLSLPVIVMVCCLRGGFGIWSLSGAVAAATFVSAFCVVTGNKLSKAKVQ